MSFDISEQESSSTTRTTPNQDPLNASHAGSSPSFAALSLKPCAQIAQHSPRQHLTQDAEGSSVTLVEKIKGSATECPGVQRGTSTQEAEATISEAQKEFSLIHKMISPITAKQAELHLPLHLPLQRPAKRTVGP